MRSLHRALCIASLALAACTSSASSPPTAPTDLEIVSTSFESVGADPSALKAEVQDHDGNRWTFSATRQSQDKQAPLALVLENSDHSARYSQLMSATKVESSLDADGAHWAETQVLSEPDITSELTAWSTSLTDTAKKVGTYFQAHPPARGEETGYSWCGWACGIACEIVAAGAAGMTELLLCEAAIGATGVGAAVCWFAVAAASGGAAYNCTTDCERTFCTDACNDQCHAPFTCDTATGNCTCVSSCSNPLCGGYDECGNWCPNYDDYCEMSSYSYYNACGRYCPATCQWYDCNGTCNGNAWYDECGVCGGDGWECYCDYGYGSGCDYWP